MRINCSQFGRFLSVSAVGAAAVVPCQAHLEIVIHAHADGQLHAHMDFPMPAPLDENIFPGLTGWAAPDPEIVSLFVDDPDEGAFTLAPTADIEIVIVDLDPQVLVWRQNTSVPIGGAIHLGGPFFQVQAVWNITDAGEGGHSYSIQFMLRDRSGTHSDSQVYTLLVAGVPLCFDFDHNHHVDLADLAILLSNFGGAGDFHDGDTNVDGTVNLTDLANVLIDFGMHCE